MLLLEATKSARHERSWGTPFLCWLLAISSIHQTAASPSGASHCATGTASMANNMHGLDGGGSLADGNYSLDLSIEDDDTTATPLSTSIDTLITGSGAHVLILKSTDTAKFRGFLFRLSAKNDQLVNANSFLALHSSSTAFARTMSICDPLVGGLTHINNMDKDEIKITLQHNDNVDLILEVTVVEKNKPSGSNLWFYNRFDIQLRGDITEVPSMSVSPSTSTQPSDIPSTLPSTFPSVVPSADPSASFSPSLSPSISEAPSVSIAPSSYPSTSSKPTREGYSQLPSSEPSQLPSSEPSRPPSSEPSRPPSSEPSRVVTSSAYGLFEGEKHETFANYCMKFIIQIAIILGLQCAILLIL